MVFITEGFCEVAIESWPDMYYIYIIYIHIYIYIYILVGALLLRAPFPPSSASLLTPYC